MQDFGFPQRWVYGLLSSGLGNHTVLRLKLVFRINAPHPSSGSTLKTEEYFIAKRQHLPTIHGA
jgi:hypothetical protein